MGGPPSRPPGRPPGAPAAELARSFGAVAAAYDRGRPGYPPEAVSWLVGDRPCTVLELGAGTGKLTQALVAAGHDVHATEPDPAMLEVLRRRVPDARASACPAERLELPDRSVDVVVAAQSFHWFAADRALPEVARVLRPGGRLALAWNVRDERIPWVRRLGAIIGSPEELVEVEQTLGRTGLFGAVEETAFAFWQDVDRELLLDLVRSRSAVSTLDEEARAATLAAVGALYDDYGRGHDGMQLPYRTRCFRAAVNEVPSGRRTGQPLGQPLEDAPAPEDGPAGRPDRPVRRVTDGPDDATLLIDFR